MEGNSPVCVALGAAWGIVVGPVGQAELRALGGPPEAGTVGLALPAPGAGDATRSDVPCSTGCTRVRCLLVKDARGGHPVRTKIGPLSVASSLNGVREVPRSNRGTPTTYQAPRSARERPRAYQHWREPRSDPQQLPWSCAVPATPGHPYASYRAGDDGRRRREAARRGDSASAIPRVLVAVAVATDLVRVPGAARAQAERAAAALQLRQWTHGASPQPGERPLHRNDTGRGSAGTSPLSGGLVPPLRGVGPGGSVIRHPGEQSHRVTSAAISAKRPDRAAPRWFLRAV